jgi:hypothetical protein
MIPYEKAMQINAEDEKAYSARNIKDRGGQLSWDESWSPMATKTGSAEMRPFPTTTTSPMLEDIRKKVLANPQIRDAAKRYLSTIPIQENPGLKGGENETPVGGQANMSFNNSYVPVRRTLEGTWEQPINNNMYSTIDMNTENAPPKKWMASAMAHELAHVALKNPTLEKEFVDFVKSITPEKNPLLYDVALQYYGNGKLPPNPEEYYATFAQVLGPNVMAVPELQKFYKNIFNPLEDKQELQKIENDIMMEKENKLIRKNQRIKETGVDPKSVEHLENNIFPISDRIGLPRQLMAGIWAQEGRGINKDNQFSQMINGKLHKYKNLENSIIETKATIEKILKQKGYDMNNMGSEAILRALQEVKPDTNNYEGDNADPMIWVNSTLNTPEWRYYAE